MARKKGKVHWWERIGRTVDATSAKMEGLKVGRRVGGWGPNDEDVEGKIVQVVKTEEKGTRYIVKLDKPVIYEGEKLPHLSFTGASLHKVGKRKTPVSGRPVRAGSRKAPRITPPTPKLRR